MSAAEFRVAADNGNLSDPVNKASSSFKSEDQEVGEAQKAVVLSWVPRPSVIACLVSIATTAWVTAPSFGASFGPIDDQEPLTWMGADGALPISSSLQTFVDETEVGDMGAAGRFRPAYYFVRVGEAVLFGDSPRAWYAVVLILYALAGAAFGYSIAVWVRTAVEPYRSDRTVRIVSAVAACVATFCFVGMRAWAGIVGRLGPSELLGLTALSLMMVSATQLSIGGRRLWWMGAISGVTVAVFAKESFVHLGLVLPIVGAYCYMTRGKKRGDLVAGFSGALPSVILGIVLVPNLRQSGSDVYGRSLYANRVSSGLGALNDSSMRAAMVAALIAAIACGIWGLWGPGRHKTAARAYVVALIAWGSSGIVVDSWFYGGDYLHTRYFAFMDWATLTLLLAASCLIVSTIESVTASVKWPVRTVGGAITIVMLAATVLTASDRVVDTRQRVSVQASATLVFQNGLDRVISGLQAGDALVVVASHGIDREPAYAILNEVARRTGRAHRQYLIVDSKAPGPLAATMNEVSRDGSTAWPVAPLEEWRPASGDVCVFINVLPRRIDGCSSSKATSIVALGM